MKTSLLIAAIAAAAVPATASTVNDTIADVRDADHVVVTAADSTVTVTIRGREGNHDYALDYTKNIAADGDTYFSENTGKWDFDFGSLTTAKKRKHYKRTTYMGGIHFGLVSAAGAKDGVDVDMAASREIGAELFGVRYRVCSRVSVSVGLGIDWRNYRMVENRRFVKQDGAVSVVDYPEGAEADFSRIKVFSLTVPFRYRWDLTKTVRFDAAAILDFNTYASIKTRYTLDGHKHKDMTKNIRQTPVTVDFKFGASWKDVGLYVKYSPCNVLKSGYGPRFKSLSVGFALFY